MGSKRPWICSPHRLLVNPLGLNEGDKFAILAIKNVRSEIDSRTPVMLPDGSRVVTEFRSVLETQPHWKEWLGSLRIERLSRANVALIRSSFSLNPQILDEEHLRLDAYLTKAFYLLRLSIVLEHEGADLLLGSSVGGQVQIRQVSMVPDFPFTRGSSPGRLTLKSVQQATSCVRKLDEMETQLPNYARCMRGLNTLMQGLRYELGQDRIHQFVRVPGSPYIAPCRQDAKTIHRSMSDLCQARYQSRAGLGGGL